MLYKIESLSLKGTDQAVKTIGSGVIVTKNDLIYLLGDPVVCKAYRVSGQKYGLAFKSKAGSKILLKEY